MSSISDNNSFDIFQSATATSAENPAGLLDAASFAHVLSRERKRAERSDKSLLLFILDICGLPTGLEQEQIIRLLSTAQPACIRETDACGWLTDGIEGGQLGIVFTEIPPDMVSTVRLALENKIREYFYEHLPTSTCERIGLKILVFPDKAHSQEEGHVFNPVFYPELFHQEPRRQLADIFKRLMDVVGAFVAILLFSPFFLVIPILIKLCSPGPVFFRQDRVGKCGTTFKIFKFRSMRIDSDDAIHRQYISKFIANKIDTAPAEGGGEVVFKLQNDPRITPIGDFLRKSSLDEIPQFFNVLKGEMSLVGPRPPIPYEVNAYYLWHCYRSFAVKPGITGLWQVSGRSRTSFDDMVRLDLKYIRNWSLWLDLKLLLATPRAVLRGKGAC